MSILRKKGNMAKVTNVFVGRTTEISSIPIGKCTTRAVIEVELAPGPKSAYEISPNQFLITLLFYHNDSCISYQDAKATAKRILCEICEDLQGSV